MRKGLNATVEGFMLLERSNASFKISEENSIFHECSVNPGNSVAVEL